MIIQFIYIFVCEIYIYFSVLQTKTVVMHARFSQVKLLQCRGNIFTLSKNKNIETTVLLHNSHTPLHVILKCLSIMNVTEL